MIRRLVLGAIALLGCAGAVGAADLPIRKSPPPPPPPVLTWDGFYLGGQIGGGWATDKMFESTAFVPPATGSASLREGGIIGGAHAGYNWQFGSMVYGLEGDFEGTSLGKSSNCLIADAGVGNVMTPPGTCFPSVLAYSYRTALPWQSSARARLGYAFDNFLVYGTGGVAIADVSTRYTQSVPGFAIEKGSQSFDRTAAGFTVGGGVEYAINANWSARAEYRFSDFGKVSNPVTSAGLFWNGYSNHHSVEDNAVLFGISYKFDALSPAVAAR
jgi:outer membrane immunogenic protein